MLGDLAEESRTKRSPLAIADKADVDSAALAETTPRSKRKKKKRRKCIDDSAAEKVVESIVPVVEAPAGRKHLMEALLERDKAASVKAAGKKLETVDAAGPVLKKPAAAGLVLGCSKCRYLKHGCSACKTKLGLLPCKKNREVAHSAGVLKSFLISFCGLIQD